MTLYRAVKSLFPDVFVEMNFRYVRDPMKSRNYTEFDVCIEGTFHRMMNCGDFQMQWCE